MQQHNFKPNIFRTVAHAKIVRRNKGVESREREPCKSIHLKASGSTRNKIKYSRHTEKGDVACVCVYERVNERNLLFKLPHNLHVFLPPKPLKNYTTHIRISNTKQSKNVFHASFRHSTKIMLHTFVCVLLLLPLMIGMEP